MNNLKRYVEYVLLILGIFVLSACMNSGSNGTGGVNGGVSNISSKGTVLKSNVRASNVGESQVGDYSWTKVSLSGGAAASYDGIAYGGGKYIAVGWNGYVISSVDGEVWTQSQLPGVDKDHYLKGIVYSNKKKEFVIVGDLGVIYTSEDGENWTKETSGIENNINGISYGVDKFIAVGESGVILSSVDGKEWTKGTIGSYNLRGISYGAGKFIVVGDQRLIISSEDGVNWKGPLPISGSSDYNITGITYGGGTFVGSVDSSDVSGIYSIDGGSNWNTIARPSNVDTNYGKLYGIAYSKNDNRFVGIGLSILSAGDLKLGFKVDKYYAKDSHKVSSGSGVNGSLKAIVYANHKFVAVGNYVSSDKSPEIYVASDNVKNIRGIVYGKDKFVAVGHQVAKYSTDDGL